MSYMKTNDQEYRSCGSLNQGAATATASSEPILKAGHLIAIFKRKITVVSRNTWETTIVSVAVVIYHCKWDSRFCLVFLDHRCHFSFKDPYFIGRIASGSGIGRGSNSTYWFRIPDHEWRMALQKSIWRYPPYWKWNTKVVFCLDVWFGLG